MLRIRCLSVALALAVASLLSVPTAYAGGYEFPGDGARAMGRGAANLARADDPITMFINPAGLASLPGTQFLFSGHLNFFKACIDRKGVDGATLTHDPSYAGGASDVPQEKICNGGGKIADRMTLVPSLGVTFRPTKTIGIGIGVHPPNSSQRMIWSDRSRDVGGDKVPGFVDAPDGVTTSNGDDGLLPSPVRYQLATSDVVVLYPTIAVGVKPFDWLQFGVSFAAGFARFKVNNYTRATAAGESEALDTPTKFSVKDRFVPRVVASVHFIPHDNLDIVGAIRVEDTIRAKGNLTTKTLLGDGAGKITYNAPRPMWVSGGIRYAHRKVERSDEKSAVVDGKVKDNMTDEVFDIELNVVYEKNTEVRDHTFAVTDLVVGTTPIPDAVVAVPHRWKDQLSIRLGGDWNAVPGKLALRTGVSYETRGFRVGRAYADYFPLERLGLHGGLTVRFNRVELSGALAHYFNKTHNNGDGLTRQVVLNPFAPPGESPVSDGDVINGGKYSARLTTLSAAFRYFFN